MIKVRYFASLREQIGRDLDIIEDTDDISSVKELKISLSSVLPPQTLCAVNYEYADEDAPVKDGDEVAFFPPVTGG